MAVATALAGRWAASCSTTRGSRTACCCPSSSSWCSSGPSPRRSARAAVRCARRELRARDASHLCVARPGACSRVAIVVVRGAAREDSSPRSGPLAGPAPRRCCGSCAVTRGGRARRVDPDAPRAVHERGQGQPDPPGRHGRSTPTSTPWATASGRGSWRRCSRCRRGGSGPSVQHTFNVPGWHPPSLGAGDRVAPRAGGCLPCAAGMPGRRHDRTSRFAVRHSRRRAPHGSIVTVAKTPITVCTAPTPRTGFASCGRSRRSCSSPSWSAPPAASPSGGSHRDRLIGGSPRGHGVRRDQPPVRQPR